MLQSGNDIRQTHYVCTFASQSVVVYRKAVLCNNRVWPKAAIQNRLISLI